MSHPELYRWYSAEEAISLFGAPNDAQHLCGGQWVIFPNIVVCLSEISGSQQMQTPYFADGARFCWVAAKPYELNDSPFATFVPAQATNSKRAEYTIKLFVRPPHAQAYLYAGELHPAYVLQFSQQEKRGIAYFDLTPTLPSAVWRQVGGLGRGNVEVADLDRTLDRLHQPTTVQDRLEVLQQLVNFWHGPITPEDGMSDTEITSLPMPMPLRFWYRWAGKRENIVSGQNILFAPRDFVTRRMLQIVNGRLLFYVENQGVYQWSTLQHGDDPPVFGRHEGKGRWASEGMTLSEHLILMCLFEAILCHANYGASAEWLDDKQLAAVVTDIPPIPIRPWRWGNTRFFAGRGAFVCVSDNPGNDGNTYYSTRVAARTEHAVQFLKPLMDKSWSRVAI